MPPSEWVPRCGASEQMNCYPNCSLGWTIEAARSGNRWSRVEPPWGVEPQTYALRVRRSNQLS